MYRMAVAALLAGATIHNPASTAFSPPFQLNVATSSSPFSTATDTSLNVGTDLNPCDIPNANAEVGSTIPNDYQMPSSDGPKPPSEFELMLGKAMDTLRQDYPRLLTDSPDFSIYHPDVEVVDPSGFKLHHVNNYKRSFNLVHMIVKLFYCPNQSSLTFRLVYDCARKNIRISWNAVLKPRLLADERRNQLHVDGISVYELDRETGLINQHRVEHLLVNDAPVKAPQGIFQAIAKQATEGPEGVPVWNTEPGNMNLVEFRATPIHTQSMLFSSSPETSMTALHSLSDDQNINESTQHELFDEQAFRKKNASRKRFNLPPITPDEFIKIEIQTKALESEQQKKASDISAARAAEMAQSKPKKQSVMDRLFSNVLQDTCESNYDCERPQVCCDFGFKKQCCRSGMGVFNGMPEQQLQKIPVRVVADDGRLPQGGPNGNGLDY